MKLVRYGQPGKEKPGLIDASGRIRDLSSVVPDLTGEYLSSRSLAKIARIKPANLPATRGTPRLGSPIGRPGNFIAIGLNYIDHAKEAGMPIPTEPVVFTKAPNCVCGPNDDTVIPKGSVKLDWEVELGIVIGDGGSYIAERNVYNHIAGFVLANDVSERHFQLETGGQWVKGKACPTFGPLGPWLVTPDEIPNVQKLAMWLDVNGKRMQTGNTKNMIFNVKKLVAYTSQFMELEPGDVIITGTPPGVGLGHKPPKFLQAGDVVTLGIEGLGEQCQTVVPWKRNR